MVRGRLALGVAGVLTLGLSGCGGISAGSLSGKSADQIRTLSVRAAEAEPGVHYQLDATTGSEQETVTGDAGTSEGQQERVLGSDEVQVELVDGTAYLQGNAGGLENTFDIPSSAATTYANKWISVVSSDNLYSSLAESVTLLAIIGQVIPTGSLTEESPSTVEGQHVIGLRGGLPGQVESGVAGSSVLYVDTKAPNVPVGFNGQASKASEKITDTGLFSAWGEQLRLTAPSGAVPFSSIPTS